MERDDHYIAYRSREQLIWELKDQRREQDMVWIIMGVVALAALLFAKRKRQPLLAATGPDEPSQEELIEEAIRVLERPRQLYAGRWFKHTVKMVECDPPRSALPPPRIGDEPQQARR